MKRYLTRLLSTAAIAAMTVAMFSCKDDPDPVIPVVSFQQATRTVGEDAGTIDVLLQLDVEAPRDITVRYAVSGTATEGTTSSSDYQVLGTYGETVITKGTTSGKIQLQIKQDVAVEADETIILTISDIVNAYATIGATPATTITLQSDDAGSKISFATATETVNETVGLVNVQLTLDKAAAQDIVQPGNASRKARLTSFRMLLIHGQQGPLLGYPARPISTCRTVVFPPIITPNRRGSQKDRLPRRTFDEGRDCRDSGWPLLRRSEQVADG